MKPAGPIEKAGTKKVAYQEPSAGPFRCGNCIHFMAAAVSSGGEDECWHPEVISDPEIKHDEDGHAKIDADGCCEYFRNGKTITKQKARRLKGAEDIMGAKK